MSLPRRESPKEKDGTTRRTQEFTLIVRKTLRARTTKNNLCAKIADRAPHSLALGPITKECLVVAAGDSESSFLLTPDMVTEKQKYEWNYFYLWTASPDAIKIAATIYNLFGTAMILLSDA